LGIARKFPVARKTGWLVLGLPPAVENGVRSDSKDVCARHEVVGMSFACADGGGGPTETEVCARMKVLIGVDPQKASVAITAGDEAKAISSRALAFRRT
jgi:hypothetical protein